MLPKASLFAARSGRIFAGLVASFFLLSTSSVVRAVDPVAPPIISYSPTNTVVQGQLPISTSYSVEISMIVPDGNSLSFPFPVTLEASSTTRPDGVALSAVADFVKFYAAPGDLVPITSLQFVGPGTVDPDLPNARVYQKTVHVKVEYPTTAVEGTYAFKIRAVSSGFPVGTTNQGSEINGSVTAPVTPPANPPLVAISTPASGSTIEVPGGTTFPQWMDFSFTATVDVHDQNPRPITSVSADIDGVPISLAPTVSKPTPVTGLGTTSVTVNVSMLVTGAGAHIVTARATNDVGLPAQPDVHTFNVVIRKSPLTVTADNQTRSYGSANPTLTYTITGFINGETLATSGVTGTPNVSTTATAFSPVLTSGTYPITPSLGSLASTKYDFVFVNGGLSVTKAVLTVQPDNILNKPYGVLIPNLTASITGVLAGDPNTPAYTGSPSLATTANILSLPGSYEITSALGSLASNNYSFEFKKGVLTIGKGTITFTATSATKTYGSANPTFGYTTTGAVAGDATPFTGAPSLTCAATPGSSVAGSPYAIVAALGSLSSAKYDFVFVDGALSVARAPMVVSAANKTKVQGTVNPALTYSVAGLVLGQTETTPGVFTTPVSISTPAVTGSPVGTYPIIVSGAVAPNYAISYNNATLTVTDATPPPAQFTACGTVFFDVNRNGCRNAEDTGLGGITVKLYENNALVASTLTAANGSYCFNVAVGSYEVDVVEIAGMTVTNCDERHFSVTTKNVTIADIGLGFNFNALRNLNGTGKSHGYWKNNISKANDDKTSGTQETKANLIAYTNTISSLMLSPFNGLTMESAETTLSASDQLKLQLLASEYNYVSGRFINNSQPLTGAFIYWGEVVAKYPSNYSSSYRTFVKNWMDAFNNSYGGKVAGPTSY